MFPFARCCTSRNFFFNWKALCLCCWKMSKIVDFEQNLTEIWPKWNKLWNCKNVENTLKIKVFRKSILFCKYLRNDSSDLYEILCGSQSLSCKLKFQISLRSMHKCACTSCKRVRARYITNARVYNSCARIYRRILMKFETWAHKIEIDHHMKFHKDLSYRCGDIGKTISTFWIL